jgi:tryptophan-rich sensory protein
VIRDSTNATAHPVLGLFGWLALVAATAALGARASIDAATFYRTLSLPEWAPPPGVFGPVWSILYAAMAVSAWMVWKRAGWRGAGGALALFCVQLALNALWSWLFFAWRKGDVALVDLAVLWVVVLIVTVRFFRVSKLAAALLVPYLLWLSFAGALNYAVVQRNPAQLAVVR